MYRILKQTTRLGGRRTNINRERNTITIESSRLDFIRQITFPRVRYDDIYKGKKAKKFKFYNL